MVLVTTQAPLALGSALKINGSPVDVLGPNETYSLRILGIPFLSDVLQLYIQDQFHYYAALNSDGELGCCLLSLPANGPVYDYTPFGGRENGLVQDGFDLPFVDGHFDSVTFVSDEVPEPRFPGVVAMLFLGIAAARRRASCAVDGQMRSF